MRPLHHIGYWVDDLDSAMKQWTRDLGVGPFQVIEHVPLEDFVLIVDGQHHDDVVFDRLAAAYGVVPGTVSHVSWVVPDLAAESARLEGLGCRLINTARSGPISVAWHHGGPLFPHPVEVHEHNDVIAGMHYRLVALRAAADW
jgi:hypothetical protein